MPRACDKTDTQPFDIIEWITDRVDFQLAAVTGAGVNGPNTECAAEYFEYARLQHVSNPQRVVTRRRWLRDNACATDSS
jgi:hypothetical protein